MIGRFWEQTCAFDQDSAYRVSVVNGPSYGWFAKILAYTIYNPSVLLTCEWIGVEIATAEGYTFFFYGTDRKMPFATLVTKDTDYDRVSNLDRPGVFRLNIGVSKQTYQSLFGADGIAVSGYDFTAITARRPGILFRLGALTSMSHPGVAV